MPALDCTALDYYQDRVTAPTVTRGRTKEEAEIAVQYSRSRVKSDVTWAVAISPPTTSTTYPCSVQVEATEPDAANGMGLGWMEPEARAVSP